MNTYELTVVLAGSMPDSKQKAVVDKIKKAIADSGGSVTKADEWGKKELAYKIRGEGQGFYHFFELSLPPDRTSGVNRMIENDEQVLRHLLVVKSSGSRKDRESREGKEKPEEKIVIDKRKKKAETDGKSTKGTKSTGSTKGKNK